MSAADPRQSAAEYFQKAYELQMAGEFQQAIEFYSRSIEAFPTAEAYTFRGWTYSFLGNYDRAISECLEAIQVDPEFGNPYNDIGAYLIEQEKWEEAVPWFRKSDESAALRGALLSAFQPGARVRASAPVGKGQGVLSSGVCDGSEICGSIGGVAKIAGYV